MIVVATPSVPATAPTITSEGRMSNPTRYRNEHQASPATKDTAITRQGFVSALSLTPASLKAFRAEIDLATLRDRLARTFGLSVSLHDNSGGLLLVESASAYAFPEEQQRGDPEEDAEPCRDESERPETRVRI